jgi:hypothetical protein
MNRSGGLLVRGVSDVEGRSAAAVSEGNGGGAVVPLTGWSGDQDYFAFRQHDEFVAESVVDLLRGDILGVMFKGVVSREVCERICEQFWASPHRRTRGVEAPGYYLGTYHYHKTTEGYLDDVEAAAPGLAEVLAVPGEPIGLFRQGMTEALAKEGVDFRLARHGGREACLALLRSWHGTGEYALAPHEDQSQCREPQQADFEIQRVVDRHVAALNICLENGEGGRLVIWNVIPDEDSKRRHGLTYTGSPYPLETLEGFTPLSVPVEPGDIYLFNGAHVHAVEPNTGTGRRTTAAAILGFVDDSTVVTWT